MQTTGKLFDDFARIMTTAAGAAQGAAREVESLMRTQMERLLGELDLVRRDEFEAVKAVAQAARAQGEALEKRLIALEAGSSKSARAAPAARRVNRPVRAKLPGPGRRRHS